MYCTQRRPSEMMSVAIASGCWGLNSKVRMVGHEYVGVQRRAGENERLAQPMQVAVIVLLSEKAWLAIVAALHNM